MIQKISPAEIDSSHLSARQKHSSVSVINPDYKNIVVNKPWGYEYLAFENEHVAIWILFLKQDAKTSMHCHPKKKTSLLVLEGEVCTSFLGSQMRLETLDGVIIEKGAFHSTAATSDSGAFVMEIETPVQKSDLVRLSDEYGRENKGYEGGQDLSTNLEQYEHQSFHDELSQERKLIEKVIRKSRIMLHSKEDWENLYNEIHSKSFCILSFLDTSLHSVEGEIILSVGEICDRDWFLRHYASVQPSSRFFTVLTVY